MLQEKKEHPCAVGKLALLGYNPAVHRVLSIRLAVSRGCVRLRIRLVNRFKMWAAHLSLSRSIARASNQPSGYIMREGLLNHVACHQEKDCHHCHTAIISCSQPRDWRKSRDHPYGILAVLAVLVNG
jgi:hypothetical protein